jgi:glutamine cyclotransferase
LTGLMPEDVLEDPVAVLIGIAFDQENDRLFVTGKLWPRIYEIRIKK